MTSYWPWEASPRISSYVIRAGTLYTELQYCYCGQYEKIPTLFLRIDFAFPALQVAVDVCCSWRGLTLVIIDVCYVCTPFCAIWMLFPLLSSTNTIYTTICTWIRFHFTIRSWWCNYECMNLISTSVLYRRLYICSLPCYFYTEY